MKEAANKKMAEEELEEDFMLAQALALSMEEANAAGSASAAALTSSTTTNAASETNSNNTSTPAWSSSASALPPLSSSQATNNQQEIADFFLKLLPSALSAVTQQQQQAQPPQEGAKLVLCVRTDLKMTTGKIAAQCSHATLGLYKYGKKHHKELIRLWEAGATPKIALRIRNEEEMMALQAQASSLGLPTHIVSDAGRTQVERGTRTVLAILGPKSQVDQVTGQLRLL
ncbi:Peptidyl-tRNA hydrolase PTH2 [Balamuthia mandrillaris]